MLIILYYITFIYKLYKLILRTHALTIFGGTKNNISVKSISRKNIITRILLSELLTIWKNRKCKMNSWTLQQVCSPITESDRILSTQNGQIRGMCVKTPVYYSSTNRSTSADIMIWRSVPYAQPPVGNLRFRAPVPLSGQWSGIRDGRSAPKACLQQRGMIRESA